MDGKCLTQRREAAKTQRGFILVVVHFATFGGASSLSRPAVILPSRLVSSLAPPNVATPLILSLRDFAALR
jgi:hypothetical protein